MKEEHVGVENNVQSHRAVYNTLDSIILDKAPPFHSIPQKRASKSYIKRYSIEYSYDFSQNTCDLSMNNSNCVNP